MSLGWKEIQRKISNGHIVPEEIALIIVDMQRGFMPGKNPGEGELPVPQADKLIPSMNRTIEIARDSNVTIIYTGDNHTEHSPSFFTTFGLDEWVREKGIPRVIYRGLVPAYIIENDGDNQYQLHPLCNKTGISISQLDQKEFDKLENFLKQPVSADTFEHLALYPASEAIEATADAQKYLRTRNDNTPILANANDSTSYIHAFSGVLLIPPHCVENSRGAEFAEGLLLPRSQDKVIYKGGIDHVLAGDIDAKSALMGDRRLFISDLPRYLAEKNIKIAYVCGVAGEVCAYRTASDLTALQYSDSQATKAIEDSGTVNAGNMNRLQRIRTALISDLCQPLNESRFNGAKQDLQNRGAAIVSACDVQQSFSSYLVRENGPGK